MRPRPVPIRKLLAATLLCGGGVASPAPLGVLVSDARGRPLPEAVVFLPSATPPATARPLAGVEIAQEGRQFIPQVSVVTVGTEVAFPNRDSVRHHVYSFSAAKNFELKLYTGKPANPVHFDRPGIAVLGCNIHDQMVAWVVVLETPFFARTDAQGRAKLDAPVGAYKLRAWHPDLPPGEAAVEQPLQLGAAGTTALRVPVTPPITSAEAAR